MQWVYYGEDGAGPAEVLDEVQAQLLGAYAFIQDREAEAPAQYRAVQSYRAAMAVLRQQRTFIGSLYERGQVDEEEREQLDAAVDAAMRHLDMTGTAVYAAAPAVHVCVRSCRVLPHHRIFPSHPRPGLPSPPQLLLNRALQALSGGRPPPTRWSAPWTCFLEPQLSSPTCCWRTPGWQSIGLTT
jgi:hypothetical protein